MATRRDPNAAAQAIFNPTGKTYLYSHKALYRYSEEYNRVVGHISTGSALEDMKLMNEEVHVGGSIEDMLRLFRDGVHITLRDPRDLAEIYDHITQHLNNWIEYINYDLNIHNAPMEGLTLMEEFAEAIYPQAVGYRPEFQRPPSMKNRAALLFGGISREQAVAQAAENQPVKHSPLIGRLEDLLAARNDGKSKLR